VLPKPQVEVPTVYGVEPSYLEIGHLRVMEGRFFDANDNAASAPVCVLGAAAKDSLFGAAQAVGEYVKLNELWCHVDWHCGPAACATERRFGRSNRGHEQSDLRAAEFRAVPAGGFAELAER